MLMEIGRSNWPRLIWKSIQSNEPRDWINICNKEIQFKTVVFEFRPSSNTDYTLGNADHLVIETSSHSELLGSLNG